MKRNSVELLKILVLAAVLLGLTIPAHAGWVQVDRDGSKLYISKGRMKVVGEGMWFISDMNRGEITWVNTTMGIYSHGTIDDYCKAMVIIKQEVEKKMEEMMKGMPPEQRQMMEQMMKMQEKAPKVSVVKAGKGGVIAGFNTVKYKVTVDGRPYKEVWLTTDASFMKELGGKKAFQFGQKMDKCIAKSGGMGTANTPEDSPEYIELIEKGWELKSINYGMGGPMTSPMTSEVVKLEKKKIPASEFQPPKGYKKVSFNDMFKGQMMGE